MFSLQLLLPVREGKHRRRGEGAGDGEKEEEKHEKQPTLLLLHLTGAEDVVALRVLTK